MKNNLLDLKFLKSTFSVDYFPTSNSFLELVAMNKMEEGEMTDATSDLSEIFDRIFFTGYDHDNGQDYIDKDYESNYELSERIKNELESEEFQCSDPNELLYAGYVDCMDEAIRFLIEEENISPEHPIVANLKDHLEKSKKKILNGLSFDDDVFLTEDEFKLFSSADNYRNENSALGSFFTNNGRDSG